MEAARRSAISERLGWDEIRTRYPNQWVVLIDIDWIDQDCDFEFRSAVVAATSIDSAGCLRATSHLRHSDRVAAHLYTGPVART